MMHKKKPETIIKKISRRLRGRTDHLRYLPHAFIMEEAVTPKFVKTAMIIVCVGMISFFIWASLTEINEVANAKGEIVPAGKIRIVEHLEGGIIAGVFHRDGDQVKAGDILLRLDGTAIRQDLIRAKQRLSIHFARRERLTALIEGRKPEFDGIKNAPEIIVDDQGRIYLAKVEAMRVNSDIIRRQIGQRQKTLEVLQSRVATLNKNIPLIQLSRDKRKSLSDRKLSSQFSYLEAEERLHTSIGEQKGLLHEIERAEQEIEELQGELIALEQNERVVGLEELDELDVEIREDHTIIAKLSEQVNRLEIRAPISGLVKGLTVTNVGEVIRPGEKLMEVVPIGETLVAEVRISPRDIGHVSIGQLAHVRVSSFDFSRFGSLDGTIDKLSATTFVGEDGESYYLGKILLKNNYVGHDSSRNQLLPGMTLDTQIITGGKTILAYLLKPIHYSINSALTER